MASATRRVPKRADDLGALTLPDADEREHQLGDLWHDGPAVLVFLRHYGWTFCREYAVQLHRARDEFEAAGAGLVVVGQGTPAHAADFRRRQKVDDLLLLVDTDRTAYQLAGTRRASVTELLGPKVALKGLRSTLRGHPQGPTFGGGDPAQLGGVLVVAPGGSIPWGHLSEDASDNPPVDEVLAAARKAAAGV